MRAGQKRFHMLPSGKRNSGDALYELEPQCTNRVRELRVELEMTQEMFADYIGCSRSTIAYLESDPIRKPRAFLAELMAKKCGVTPGYVRGTEDKKVYTPALNHPKEKQYVIVAFKINPEDRWGSYAVCFWDGVNYRRVEDGMFIGGVLPGIVIGWTPLPMLDIEEDEYGEA